MWVYFYTSLIWTGRGSVTSPCSPEQWRLVGSLQREGEEQGIFQEVKL